MKRLLLGLVLTVALFAQAPKTDVNAVFGGNRPHVPSDTPVTVSFQPSDAAAPRVELSTTDIAGVVARVDTTLRKFASWGLNPKGLTLDDFEVVFEVVKGDAKGGVGVPPKTYMKVTWVGPPAKSESFDVALMAKYGAYPTATVILQLADAGVTN